MKNLLCPSCNNVGNVFVMVAGDYGCSCGFVAHHSEFEDIDTLDEHTGTYDSDISKEIDEMIELEGLNEKH